LAFSGALLLTGTMAFLAIAHTAGGPDSPAQTVRGVMSVATPASDETVSVVPQEPGPSQSASPLSSPMPSPVSGGELEQIAGPQASAAEDEAVVPAPGTASSQEPVPTATPAAAPKAAKKTKEPLLPAVKGGVDCSKTKCVALTFDDGPDAACTEKILTILAKKGARATFFVQGYRVAAYPKIVKRAVAEGHEIGNHSWNHKDYASIKTSAVKKQVKQTNQAVKKAAGITPVLVRPPYGSVKAKVLRAVGAPVILWNVDTRDWETKNAKKILAHVRGDTKPGSIILMHDTHKADVKALPKVIDALQKKGYTLVTVSELLNGKLRPGEVYYGGPAPKK
jgi:peptidoglycan/xylan/chitin deacetylase (PgdA/CDA1 family)